ncbi:hypothetical protein LSH36_183g01017 [Paralvinella palmiformis]|uniref:Uncharacterized protein n=1 Tax=Paralvinella palmiformis TaxID=53620 RepID=A0AAD9JRI5_9ANNE|nr:hypothetical protein LSH36_183g01017 [Paralvinella palmiformis]
MIGLNCCRRQTCCGYKYMDYDTNSGWRRDDIDGPYAWMIALVSCCGHLLIYGILFSSGVFYGMFCEIFDGSSSTLSLTASLSASFTYGFSRQNYGSIMIILAFDFYTCYIICNIVINLLMNPVCICLL